MRGYCKLSGNLINSSVWDEPDSVRIVWITLLAMSDATGFVASSLPGLAHQCRKTREETISALQVLEAPDPDSQNPDHEGRRIAKVEGGWLIFNYILHRAQQQLSDDPETVASRERMRKFRERKRKEKEQALYGVTGRNVTQPPVTGVSSASASASASASKKKCTKEEAVQYCTSIGLPGSDGVAMFLHWEEKGWAKVKDWKLTIQKWKSFGYLPSQKAKKPWAKPTEQSELDKRLARDPDSPWYDERAG